MNRPSITAYITRPQGFEGIPAEMIGCILMKGQVLGVQGFCEEVPLIYKTPIKQHLLRGRNSGERSDKWAVWLFSFIYNGICGEYDQERLTLTKSRLHNLALDPNCHLHCVSASYNCPGSFSGYLYWPICLGSSTRQDAWVVLVNTRSHPCFRRGSSSLTLLVHLNA